eukprot:388891_1
MTEKDEIKDCDVLLVQDDPEDHKLRIYYEDNCNKELTGKFVYIVLLQLMDNPWGYKISIDQRAYKKLGYVATGTQEGMGGACHRIVCSTKDRLPKVIKLRNDYTNKEILINYSDIEWTKIDCNNNGIDGIHDIRERKLYYGAADKNVYEIYQECIKIHVGYKLSEPDVLRKLLNAINYFGTDSSNPNPMESIKQIESDGDVSCMPILYETERNMQIYFHLFENNGIMPYGVTNSTVKNSKVFFGAQFGRHGSEKIIASSEDHMMTTLTDFIIPVDNAGWIAYNFNLPFYYNNMTELIHLYSRYNFIKTKCLYGQDNEFNIFRSLCFICADLNPQEMVVRLSIGILCLILQICLTVGIVMQVIDNWDLDEMFDNDGMIITISLLVFAFIS